MTNPIIRPSEGYLLYGNRKNGKLSLNMNHFISSTLFPMLRISFRYITNLNRSQKQQFQN